MIQDAPQTKIFMDSGAYSTFSYGLPPQDVHEYIRFIEEHEHNIHIYANLDVIGDAEATWKNQAAMEKAGLTPLPVFHPVSDNVKWLHKCINEYEYFAIGGVAHNPSITTRIKVLDKCWHLLVDKDGKPTNKVHGFGLAAPKLIFRYPWYSIDTSSYMDYGQYGMIIMPKRTVHGYDYNTSPVKVFCTARSPKRAKDGTHFENLSKAEQSAVLEYLRLKNVEYGTSEFREVEKGYKPEKGVEVWLNKEHTIIEKPIIEGISNTNFWRDTLNFIYYLDIAEKTGPYEDRRFLVPQHTTLF